MKKTKLTFLPNELMIVETSRVMSILYFDIISICCDKPYLIINTTKNKLIILYSLNDLIKQLPHFFCQCNKSVIINLLHAKSLFNDKNCYITTENFSYSISRRKKSQVWQKFQEVKANKCKNEDCWLCKNTTAQHTN